MKTVYLESDDFVTPSYDNHWSDHALSSQLLNRKEYTMSNLGTYQDMVILSKKVGGPLNLLGIITLIVASLTQATNYSIQKLTRYKDTRDDNLTTEATIYPVLVDGIYNDELDLRVRDKSRILWQEEGWILIDKLGDSDNPHLVSTAF